MKIESPLYLSLFSGIGGFDCGLDRAGWRCVGQVECDKSALSVLAHHWPDVPKFEDVRRFNARSIAVRPDLICGGFPCQDLSVAGRRAGLAGERSGLFFEFMRIVGELAPAWVLIENVPGLLSSNGGRDMGTVVGRLADMGYGWAYRVLDAQWFGLAQQRRRVFIAGRAGADVRRAAEVLFERESLPWDSPPSREAGARTARCLANGSGSSGQRYDGDTETFVASAFKELGVGHSTFQKAEISSAFRGNGGGGIHANLIAHALTAEGHDASEDGTGRGTPIVPVAYAIQERAVSENATNGPQGKGWQEERAFTMEARHHAQAVARGGVRRLTPKECCRLQGFPDDWLDGLGLSDSAKYRLLGNAVAVPVAEWIARRMA